MPKSETMKAAIINERYISQPGFGAKTLFYLFLLSILGLSKVFASTSAVSVSKGLVFNENVERAKIVNFFNSIVR